MSLCGLLRAIVLSYLLKTACTVTACSGRSCLFVFDPLGAQFLVLGPQVNMYGFQIKVGLLALVKHLGMKGGAVGEKRLFCFCPCLKWKALNCLRWALSCLGFLGICLVSTLK